MSLTGANYNVLWDKSDNALEFADNAKANNGTGLDLVNLSRWQNIYAVNSTGDFSRCIN